MYARRALILKLDTTKEYLIHWPREPSAEAEIARFIVLSILPSRFHNSLSSLTEIYVSALLKSGRDDEDDFHFVEGEEGKAIRFSRLFGALVVRTIFLPS